MGSPAFQFYPNDWLGSVKIAIMPPEYEGGYIRLLCWMWNDEDCSLPDNDEILSTLSRLNERWFNGGSTVVRKCFIPHPTKVGFVTNKRLQKERNKQLEWSEKSRQAGIKSAEKRAENKNKQPLQPPFNHRSTTVQPNVNTQSQSQSQSSFTSSTQNEKNEIFLKNIELRKTEFLNELENFKEKYEKEMLHAFFNYWTEKTPGGKKMRFELQKTWELSKRLFIWKNNNFKNNGKQSGNKLDIDKFTDALKKYN